MDKLSQKIVIIDDDDQIRGTLKALLEEEKFAVLDYPGGKQALHDLARESPDLILLDWMMPDATGLEICRKIRSDSRTAHIPIIMITGRNSSADEILGLELGADDYVTKPFDFQIVLLRIRKLLRREISKPLLNAPPLTRGSLTILPDKHRVLLNGTEICFTSLEFRILLFLAKAAGQVFSREEIVRGAWSDDLVITDRAVDVHLNSIRKKLGSASDLIETVRGAGYRFSDR